MPCLSSGADNGTNDWEVCLNGGHESKLIQHLELIGGVCDECRLAKLIDRRIEQKRRKVSVDQAVRAMILTALGFTGPAHYFTPRLHKTANVLRKMPKSRTEQGEKHDSGYPRN